MKNRKLDSSDSLLRHIGIIIFTTTLGLCVCYLWHLLDPRDILVKSIDLTPSYTAAKLWLQGMHSVIYPSEQGLWVSFEETHPAWFAIQEQFSIPRHDTFFAYHPFYLILFVVPIASVISGKSLAWILLATNAIATILLGSESLRLAGISKFSYRFLMGFVIAFSFPVMYAANLGQNTLLVVVLLLFSFRAYTSNPPRFWLGTLLLWISFIFKPWTFLLVFVFPFLGWRRAFFFGLGGYIGGIHLLPSWVLPKTLIQGYQNFSSTLFFSSCVACNNFSLRGFLDRITWDGWFAYYGLWKALPMKQDLILMEWSILLLIAFLFLLITLRKKPPREVLFASALALIILAPGISWSHYLIYTIPLTSLAIFSKGSNPLLRTLGILYLTALLVIIPHPQYHISPFSLPFLNYTLVPRWLLPYALFLPTVSWLTLMFLTLTTWKTQSQPKQP